MCASCECDKLGSQIAIGEAHGFVGAVAWFEESGWCCSMGGIGVSEAKIGYWGPESKIGVKGINAHRVVEIRIGSQVVEYNL